MTQISTTKPYFTIAIATYQRPALLLKAVQSVLAQSFTDYEIIIVDDASADDTPQVLQSLDAPNIRTLRLPTNQGISAARNLALHEARGELILFVDDDDRLTPDFLDQTQRAWQHFPPTVVFSQPKRLYIHLDVDGREHLIRDIDYGASSREVRPGSAYLQRPFGSGSGLVVRVTSARAAGDFKTKRLFAEDSDYMLRLALTGDMAIIPEALYVAYSHHQPQLTTNEAWIGAARERLADDHHHTLRGYPNTLCNYYLSAARAFFAIDKRDAGRRCLGKALRLRPFFYRTWRLALLLEINQVLPHKVRQRLLTTSPRHPYRRR